MTKQPIELRTRIALEEARSKALREERHKATVETEIAFRPKRTLTPLAKFRAIKPTGARDGFSAWGAPDNSSASPPPPPPPTEPPVEWNADVFEEPPLDSDRSGSEGFWGPNARGFFLLCIVVIVALIYFS